VIRAAPKKVGCGPFFTILQKRLFQGGSMGLFDSIENAALGKVAGSNPEAAAVLQMIQSHPGGLNGLVQSFHDNGMSGLVNSWTGTGPNQTATAEQIQQVLGSEKVQALAQKLGISPEAASSTLAQVLPTVIDKLTPNGSVPSGSNLVDMGKGLLSSFLGKTGTSS
jgi:uncharacterized protein YidB (DUF937 family)